MVFLTTVWAQVGNTGSLSGKVTNSKGDAVPNAAITVTNATTNSSVKVLSGSDGTFTVSPVTPGTYTIEVESTGYKRAREENVVLATAAPATVNVSLTTGNPAEVVDLNATAHEAQIDNGEINAVLNEAKIKELPVIDRNRQELIGLQNNITPPVTAFSAPEDPERNRFYATNGQSPLANDYRVDGLSNLEPVRRGEIRVNPEEAVHDMLISTSNYLENKGFAGGAVVNTTTMAGTNQLHGSLFEFNSNDDFRARNFFNAAGNPSDRLVYNQFGATVGGPVVKNSTYAFASYEGTYRRGSQTQVTTVPTAAVAAGNFSSVPGLTLFSPFSGAATGTGRTTFNGNSIPSNQINPTAAAIVSFIPAPNQPGFVDNLVANVPFQNDMQKFDGRIDQHFSGSTSMFLRYGYSNSRALMGSPLGNVIGASTRGRTVGQNAGIDFMHIFGAGGIVDARLGYNRYTNRLNSAADLTNGGLTSAFNSFNGQLFSVDIPGMAAIGTPAGTPMDGVDNNFNGAVTGSLRKSIHDLKVGLDVRRFRSDGFFTPMFGTAGTAFFGPGATMLNSANAAFTPNSQFFNSFASFLVGAPSQFGVSNFVTAPSIYQTQYGMWVGDHLNIMSKLSIDIGVRYDIFTPIKARRTGGAAFFDPATNTFSFAGVGGDDNRSLYDTDYDTIAPRFGFAFRATNKTVLRGGYGISYYQPAYMISGFMTPSVGAVAGVTGTFATATLPTTFGPNLAGRLTPTASSTFGTVNGVSAGNVPVSFTPGHLDTPYVQTFSLQVQQEFMASTFLAIGYQGALGRHLPFFENLNAAAAGAGVAGLPFANFGRTASTQLFDNSLNNNYNALDVSLTRRFTHGLSFLGSYTFSKALGYTAANGSLLDPLNLRANYGPMDWDRQHVLSIAHMWELPFGRHGNHWMSTVLGGWQWNGILTWQTGTPLTITADPLTCNCPGNTVFASLNGSGSPFLNNGPFFLNASAFGTTSGSTVGNLGRGALRGPDQTNYNMSLFKHFRFQDRFDLELRGEAYNITNSSHFANPMTNLYSPEFGRVLTTGGIGNRQLNVGFRALF
jgi:hypothetical protein